MLCMYENVKIGIIGGDMRQTALARRLSELGFETAIYGLPSCDLEGAVRVRDLDGAVRGSRAVILPLPASQDGVRVFAPYVEGEEIRIARLLEMLSADTLLVGGKFDFGMKAAAKENNIPLVDYYECEELQVRNAVPTAEGALEIAMRELPITVAGSRMLVCGHGRIGRVLAALLRNVGAHVTVAARRAEDIAWIEVEGHTAVRFGTKEYRRAVENADAVFNTVPAKLFDAAALGNMRGKLLIDLASGKGGVDFAAADRLGIRAVHALSLPGKVAPDTAGDIVCGCVLELLRREGVMAKS